MIKFSTRRYYYQGGLSSKERTKKAGQVLLMMGIFSMIPGIVFTIFESTIFSLFPFGGFGFPIFIIPLGFASVFIILGIVNLLRAQQMSEDEGTTSAIEYVKVSPSDKKIVDLKCPACNAPLKQIPSKCEYCGRVIRSL